MGVPTDDKVVLLAITDCVYMYGEYREYCSNLDLRPLVGNEPVSYCVHCFIGIIVHSVSGVTLCYTTPLPSFKEVRVFNKD